MLRALKIPSTLALECTLKKMPSGTIVDGTTKKTLSLSAVTKKRFVISDHYEFDRKVYIPTCDSISMFFFFSAWNFCKKKKSSHSSRQVINSDNPVIVNFHADWCDPCKFDSKIQFFT